MKRIDFIIYIYIYIYSHPQTDSFVVSQLFSMTRHAECLKLESKSSWLYDSRIPYPWPIVILSAREEHVFIFIYVINFRSGQFMRRTLNLRICCSWQFPMKEVNPQGEHTYCHLQTDCFPISPIIRVARHARYFKLGSKLYVSRISYTYIYIYIYGKGCKTFNVVI